LKRDRSFTFGVRFVEKPERVSMLKYILLGDAVISKCRSPGADLPRPR
jgi:hypothetical protein